MKSYAATPEQYLDDLTPERRELVGRLRETVLEHLPDGYEEGMQYGMIGYYIPLERYPVTYNGQPLGVAAIASQKNYVSLYLMGIYNDPEQGPKWIEEAFAEAGKKLNMGKSCVRFRKLDDVPFEVVGEAVARLPVDEFIARYEASRS